MQQYKSFIFESYGFDEKTGEIQLRYGLDDAYHFTERLKLPQPSTPKNVDMDALDRALFALHLIGGVSYYKTCIPKKIELQCGSLSKEQAHFFHEVYEKGLGEFFFKNDIDFRGLINFPSSGKSQTESQKLKAKSSKVLVPIGGGKDSIVTAELLKHAGYDVTLLRMTGHPIIDETVKALGLPCITIERTLDPQLFELNKQGALNGHVPITAYLTFVSLIVAMLSEFDAVVLSNERSANIGNVSFKGMVINHQWSKSLEFETMMQKYIQTSIGSRVQVFSLLRPWSELRIVEEFMRHPKYLPIATSCNKNWKIGGKAQEKRWCGQCPKCAFVFALYAAYLSPEQLEKIFGKNLYDDEALLPLYRELLGLERTKPFECVGTPEETAAAFLLARERGGFASTPAMMMFEKEKLSGIKNPELLISEALEASEEHAIPIEYLQNFPEVLSPKS